MSAQCKHGVEAFVDIKCGKCLDKLREHPELLGSMPDGKEIAAPKKKRAAPKPKPPVRKK